MVQVNLSKGLDKAYENTTLAEILAAPPSALAGLTAAEDAALKEHLGIDTVAELGSTSTSRSPASSWRWPTRWADPSHAKRAAPGGERPSGVSRDVRRADGSPRRRTRG